MDDRGPILEFLQQGRWFGALDPALQQLIVQRSIVVRFEPGDYLIEEGSPPKGLYAVLEGRVRAVRRLADGRDAPVHVGGKGFWCGDYATLAGQPSIGSVLADTRVRALFLSAAEFERIVDEEPRHYRAFMALLLERYARVFGSVAELHGLPSEERLRRRLESIAAALARRRSHERAGRHPVVAGRARQHGRPLAATPEHAARPPRGAGADRGGLPQHPRAGLTRAWPGNRR